MSTNIEGLLRNMKGRKIMFIEDENGKAMTDKEARKELADLQSKGYKLIPSSQCEGFDPFGGGCPGHPVDEWNAKGFECEHCNDSGRDAGGEICKACWGKAQLKKQGYERIYKKN